MEASEFIPALMRQAQRVPQGTPGAVKFYGDWYLFKAGGFELFLEAVADSIEEVIEDHSEQ